MRLAAKVQINLIYFSINKPNFDHKKFVHYLKSNRIIINPSEHDQYRFATHYLVTREDCDYIYQIVESYSRRTDMKFNEYPYQRIDYDSFKKDFDQCTLKISEAKDAAKTVLEGINEASKLENHLITMMTLCQIRFSINVNDKYYSAENDFWDDQSPKYQEIINKYYLALTKSPYRSQLYATVPEVFFQRLDDQVLCSDSRIILDLQQENKYVTQYVSLVAKAQIPYEGKNYTLSQLKALMTDMNRETRKTSSEAYYGYYAKHKAEFDQIYDNLVKIRTKIAKTLGFNNYVELAYKRMDRIDYDEKMVAQYRQDIVDYITPLAVSLRQKTQKRLGLETMYYYDAGVDFKDGKREASR